MFGHLREVEVMIARHDEGLRFDGSHRQFEVAIVRLLFGHISILPGLCHDEQVVGIYMRRVSTFSLDAKKSARTFGAGPRLPPIR